MQKNFLRSIPATLACIVLLTPIGCGGGGSSSSKGGGEKTYMLGGVLAGLSAGQSVSLEDNGVDKLTLGANGAFSFPMRLEAGTANAITVQSHTPGIACSVSNGSGTVGSSVMGIGVSCSAGTERILYSFGANATDGQEPYAGVMKDSARNLYGTTQTGGANSLGTVFKISSAGTETILHSFGASATDGLTPRAGVIMDSAGNLYGTTLSGGANQIGTVFKIDAAGTETILYSFGARANDGMDPTGGLIIDSAGNLYGTTSAGGSGGGTGTVYKINPAGTETILYSFGVGNTDGAAPYGGLIMDSAGNLYGTTTQGGANFEGTVFKISAAGTETILHSFGASATDGLVPTGGLIMDSAGNLYGTTAQGGANASGTVFKVDAAGTETILYAFNPSFTDGGGPGPYTGLIMDSSGNLYGTTGNGGANYKENVPGYGTVFKISAAGTETILHSFGASATDGLAPFAGLIVDNAGNLYGTTVNGGANGGGTVFVID